MLNSLETTNRPAELHPLPGIINCNPSIRGEDKAELAPVWERVDRQSFAALPDAALHRIWDNETAVYDDWKLKRL